MGIMDPLWRSLNKDEGVRAGSTGYRTQPPPTDYALICYPSGSNGHIFLAGW